MAKIFRNHRKEVKIKKEDSEAARTRMTTGRSRITKPTPAESVAFIWEWRKSAGWMAADAAATGEQRSVKGEEHG